MDVNVELQIIAVPQDTALCECCDHSNNTDCVSALWEVSSIAQHISLCDSVQPTKIWCAFTFN